MIRKIIGRRVGRNVKGVLHLQYTCPGILELYFEYGIFNDLDQRIHNPYSTLELQVIVFPYGLLMITVLESTNESFPVLSNFSWVTLAGVVDTNITDLTLANPKHCLIIFDFKGTFLGSTENTELLTRMN